MPKSGAIAVVLTLLAVQGQPVQPQEACWDSVSAIQVEVLQYPALATGNASSEARGASSGSASSHRDPGDSAKRAIDTGLPAPLGHSVAPTDPLKSTAGRDIVHTRGHFNSLIVIVIFAGLACVSIMGYCIVVFRSAAEDESLPDPKKEASPEDTRLRDAMAAREKRMRSPSPEKVSKKMSSDPEVDRRRSSKVMKPTDTDFDTDTEDSSSKERRRRSMHHQASTSLSPGGKIVEYSPESKVRDRRNTWSTHAKVWSKERWSPEESEETMSAFAFVVNVVADLCPSGFLSIAYGMDGTGYIWALVIMIIFYGLCVYTMWCCGRTCEISGEMDFSSQWALVVGPGGSWIPLLVIVIVAFGALLCYACFFGDLLEEVMPALGFHVPRYACLISFSLFPALPLCLLKNLSALAYSSFFAFMALVYTAVVMVVRCGDGSYAVGGHFFSDLEPELSPDLPAGGYLLKIGPKSLLFINILAMAFHCHCNACKYYRELKDTTPRHFRNCTILAMGIAAVLYGVMGYAGFKTFGTASNGTILKNYSLEDMPVNIARVFIALSLAASYAIMFSALREAFIGILKHIFSTGAFDLVWRQDILSGCLVALVTICGVVAKDSGLVDGFVGAICGNAIIYIIPCLLYVATVKNFLDKRRNRSGLAFTSCLILLGVILAIAGCAVIVLFEVEAEKPRPVQHHWTHHVPLSNVTQKHKVKSLPGPRRHMFQNITDHTHPFGFRPRGRHIWAMR